MDLGFPIPVIGKVEITSRFNSQGRNYCAVKFKLAWQQ